MKSICVVPALALALAVLLAGCATPPTPLVNWDKRVGNYTYNLALMDLGVPRHSTKLSDGKLVADWITRTGAAPSLGDVQPPGFKGAPFRDNYGIPTATPATPNRHLRLTFDQHQKLVAWEKYTSFKE